MRQDVIKIGRRGFVDWQPFPRVELAMIKTTLRHITSSKIKLLPQMTDGKKLNAMMF